MFLPLARIRVGAKFVDVRFKADFDVDLAMVFAPLNVQRYLKSSDEALTRSTEPFGIIGSAIG